MTFETLRPRKRQANVCARCGSTDIHVEHRADVVDFKGLTLEVHGLAQTCCNVCDLSWMTPGQESDNLAAMRDAFAERRDAIRAEEGLLTGEAIESALAQLKLTKTQASELFGGGPNAFGKYVSGEVLQSFPMDRLIRLTVAFGPSAVFVLKRGARQPLTLCSAYFAMSTSTGATTQATAVTPLGANAQRTTTTTVPA